MIPWFKRFFTDEEVFLKWQRRVATALAGSFAAIAFGLSNGNIPWPEFVPKGLTFWLIPLLGGCGAAVGVGQMNRSITQTKAIADGVVTEPPPASPHG